MTISTPKPKQRPPLFHDHLRQDAEVRLKLGKAPPTNGWSISGDTLMLLHNLASNPATAPDALKLLYELQVHQVELDLQHAQLEATELETAHALSRYKAIYDFAPVGYLIVSRDGHINECNLAGARLLGVKARKVEGRALDTLFAPSSRSTLTAALLQCLREGSTAASCEVHCADGEDVGCSLSITANLSAAGETILLVLTRLDRSQQA